MARRFSVRAILEIDISGPGAWPAATLAMARRLVKRATRPLMNTWASCWRTSGSPDRPMWRTSSISRAVPAPPAPPPPPPMAARSFMRVVRATAHPPFTSPRRWVSGMRTSVKKTSLNDAPPVIWRRGRTSTPGARMSTMNPVSPRCLGWSGSVRQMTSPMSARWAKDVHTFCPLTTHSSPSRTARVFRLARSLPAPGSLNSWQPTMSPRYMAPR